MPNKLLLVDDHPVMIETLGTAIRKTYPNTEVFEADSISAARYAIRQRIAQPQSAFPRADVLGGICLRPPPKTIANCFLVGPSGFPSKSLRRKELETAIRKVIAVGRVLPNQLRVHEDEATAIPRDGRSS